MAKAQLLSGTDPTTKRQVEKLRAAAADVKTFEHVANEWRATKYPDVSKTGDDALHWVKMNIFRVLCSLPIATLDPLMVFASLRRIEARGSLDMTKRVQRLVVRIFNYAIACGLCKDNKRLLSHTNGHHYEPSCPSPALNPA